MFGKTSQNLCLHLLLSMKYLPSARANLHYQLRLHRKQNRQTHAELPCVLLVLPRASSHSSSSARPAHVESTSELDDAATKGSSTGSRESPRRPPREPFIEEHDLCPPLLQVPGRAPEETSSCLSLQCYRPSISRVVSSFHLDRDSLFMRKTYESYWILSE